MIISPFSAIFSWEGYEYQGHISLFVVLKYIHERLNGNRDSIENLFLEIEGAEDFSIIENNKYVSLHQVKRGSFNLDQNGKKDKFSFIISLLQYEAERGYYHILPSKNLPNDFVKSTSEHIEKLIADLSKEVMDKSDVDEKDYDKYIMMHKINHKAKKGTLYDVLYFVCDDNKERASVETGINQARIKLERYLSELRENDVLITDEKLFEKFDPSFKNSIVLKEESYKLIEDILRMEKPGWTFVDENYAKLVYYKIYVELKLLIEKEFIEKPQNKVGVKFAFSDIYGLITKDHKAESNSKEYQYYLLWESINDLFLKYPSKNSNDCIATICEECSTKQECNLYTQIKRIVNYNNDEINKFLYRIMLKEPNPNRPNNLPNDSLIERLLLKLLKEIDMLRIGDKNLIQAQKDGSLYRLTLDSSGEVEELYEWLEGEQNNVNGDKLLIYESDVLITDQLDHENFIYDGINTNKFGEKEYKELEGITSDSIDKLRKNCHKPKVLRLVSRKQVREELKSDRNS